MSNILETKGNDSVMGSGGSSYPENSTPSDEILTGGGGNDTFYNLSDFNTTVIPDFGGVGKGVNPSAAVIAEVDTLNFNNRQNASARNMLLTQNGNNLEITFVEQFSSKVILQNFALENLDNLSKSTGATVNLGNILFYGQTTITDSFDVFNGKSTQSTIFNKNTVTFLNDLSNNVKGFDNSDDVINGEGGDDIIDGLSGNDLLRGGAGNNTLNGGTGDDSLNATGTGDSLLNGDDGNDFLYAAGYETFSGYYKQSDKLISSGNNTLKGGAGNDTLDASGSGGNNLLSGGDGNDSLNIGGSLSDGGEYAPVTDSRSRGNNTLDGGTGDDTLNASGSAGNNLLSGGDGNDSLNISGLVEYNYDASDNSISSGNNTLNGGAGNDTLNATGSKGDNLLNGGDGNDSIYIGSQSYESFPSDPSTLVTQTVDGGKGDDLLSVDYSNYNATGGITTTFNPTTDISSITAGRDRVNYKNIERLNILGTAYDDNIVGGNGNDTLGTGSSGNDTIDGGKGDDILSVNYSGATERITNAFNATTNIGLITAGTNRVDYKNIERLNISGTAYNDNIVGNDGNDTLDTGSSGKDTIDGGKGDDVLSVSYIDATGKLTTTFNATTKIGSITAGTNRVDYKNIERLNISGTVYNDKIVGNDGNDTLSGRVGNDTLTGGAGNDTFVFGGPYSTNAGYPYYDGADTITDFGGVGKDSNPSVEVINSLDTLQFTANGFTAQNLQLTQNGNNLEITFEVNYNQTAVILQNFKLENLDNLAANSSRPAIGNILFNGETSITDSFDVFDADSTQTNLFKKNTVTFLNDLNNNIIGFDNSNDVINGQGGDDIINGLSGNDILRANDGNDTLIGGAGNDTLESSAGNNSLDGGTGDDTLSISSSTGNNTLNGGTGDDTLSVSGAKGDNLLSGGDGNDSVYLNNVNTSFLGNNTLEGGAGSDYLSVRGSKGDNLLSGGDGNDFLYIFSTDDSDFSGNNTLEGGTGDDSLSVSSSTGNNLLSGGDGNDTLSVSSSTGNNLLSGGNGNDALSVSSSTGNNLLFGGDGNDTLTVDYGSTGDNLLDGGDGNDSIYIMRQSYPPAASTLVTQTVDGGNGDDLLVDDSTNATNGITTTFNPTTNIGSITDGTNRVNYKNIERLNISGTVYDDNIVGGNGNDTLSGGDSGKDTIDGGEGDDVLSVNYSSATVGITSIFNPTTNIGSITAGTNQVNYKNIERLNISGTVYDDNIVGGNGNDTLSGGDSGKDTIDGGKGDDVLSVNYSCATVGITTTFNPTTNIGSITAGTNQVSYKNIERLNISGTAYNDNIVGGNGNDTLSGGGSGNDTLTGGAGNDTFAYGNSDTDTTITDFGGVGKNSDPSVEVINSLDTLQFVADGFTAQNLQLTQNGNNLEITFEGDYYNTKVVLQNFKLENLDNLAANSSRPAIGNILFSGDSSVTDSFDVFEADSTQTNLFNKNTVTFLNDLNNNITGFDNSNDVINGQGGDDIINGLSGNDILRGDAGNDTLIGGVGNDTLESGEGNNILNGGTGDDRLSADDSRGDNTLYGGVGDDRLSADDSRGDNTLNGGAGYDTLSARESRGDNLLLGGDGNDYLDILNISSSQSLALGNNTLKGGAGDDTLNAQDSKGDNFLSGGDGNDILTGGRGNDSLYGGNGTDTFAFYDYKGGVDTIYDFNATNELIQVLDYSPLSQGSGLSTGLLQKNQFTIGTSATTSEERFIYNSATGALYFDKDGSATGFSQVQLAQLSTGLSLTNNNFAVGG